MPEEKKKETAGPPRYKRGRELAGLSVGQAARLLGIERTRLTDIGVARKWFQDPRTMNVSP